MVCVSVSDPTSSQNLISDPINLKLLDVLLISPRNTHIKMS